MYVNTFLHEILTFWTFYPHSLSIRVCHYCRIKCTYVHIGSMHKKGAVHIPTLNTIISLTMWVVTVKILVLIELFVAAREPSSDLKDKSNH